MKDGTRFHNAVRDALHRLGHQITYDWTSHGGVFREGLERLREVAVAELAGIEAADYIVVLLPGGRGTHTELGFALAHGKPALMLASRDEPDIFEPVERTCAFYHHPLVVRCHYLADVLDAASALPDRAQLDGQGL